MTPDSQPKTERQRDAALHHAAAQKILELLMAAFSLVAALAWNDAIQSLFARIFGSAAGIIAKFFYAAIVTVIAVFVILRLSRIETLLQEKILTKK